MAVAYRHSTGTTYASRTNTTLTAPTGIQDGDVLLIIWMVGHSGSVATGTPPAGFSVLTGFPNNIHDTGNFYVNLYAWYKIASGESGDYTVTHSANSSQGVILAYSGADQSTPFAPNPTINSGTGNTSTATGLTTARDGSIVIFVDEDWGDSSNNLTAPTGTTPTFTERFDTIITYVADGVLATAGNTGNKTFTSNTQIASNPWQAFLFAIQPPGDQTKTLADSGAGTDSVTANAAITLADGGTGADSIITGHPLADSGTGSDNTTVTVAAPIGDIGTGADSITVAAAAPLNDIGAGANSITVTAAVTLADVGNAPNLLTANQASVETNTTGFSQVNGTVTIARTTDQAAHGAASLQMTSTGAQNYAQIDTTPAISVVQGISYTAVATARVASTTRQFKTAISWRTGGGAWISNSVSSGHNATNADWVTDTVTATPPSNAATASVDVIFYLVETGEVFYVDKFGFFAGGGTAWRMPGDAGDAVTVNAATAIADGGDGADQLMTGASVPYRPHGIGAVTVIESALTTAAAVYNGASTATAQNAVGQTTATVTGDTGESTTLTVIDGTCSAVPQSDTGKSYAPAYGVTGQSQAVAQ